ncbi:hypothetical protein MXD62_26060 [Frankia sp. Mgl5]|nr:hypothetical protein [Frankia sp. Mgl5]
MYRAVTVKHVPGGRTFVAVDGGMSDNPRPALYDSQYTVELIGRPRQAPARTMTVVGRHCESGDVLARDVPLPADVAAGDLLAVACTGAYHHSLASTYNLGRPPARGRGGRRRGPSARAAGDRGGPPCSRRRLVAAPGRVAPAPAAAARAYPAAPAMAGPAIWPTATDAFSRLSPPQASRKDQAHDRLAPPPRPAPP